MRASYFTTVFFLAVLGIACWFTIPAASAPSVTAIGPRQSSSIALTADDRTLVNVNPEANTISVFDVSGTALVKLDEVKVGRDPESVAVQPDGTSAYVANSFDGTVSVVNLKNLKVKDVLTVGVEPSAVAVSPNGTRLYVANSSSNNLVVFDSTKKKPEFITSIDLSPFGTAPRAISITNDGDKDDTDETVFVALFFAQLRPGKTAVNETEDDQREGRVVAISAASNNLLSPTITLQPITDTGFNANGRLSPGPNQIPNVPSTNPQTFTTPTGCYPNQLASIAIHPSRALAYVVSTGASPNGPQRFNVMAQGMVSVYNTTSGAEITSGQTDPAVRRKAPLNLNQGINIATTPAPRLFLTNPVAMTWRPDGSDAWVVVQHADLLVRLTVDADGIPTIGAPLVAGPSQIVRVDLEDTTGISGKAPRGVVINSAGNRAYTSNFVSRSVTSVDISTPTAPSILATAQSTALPAPGTFAETAHLGEELFFTGRGPQGRMSQEAWGGCVVCHPKGRTDNATWHFDAGPRQTIPLDGMISDVDFHDQRILNWSAVRDENQDFELNTRNVFGGRGLIDDDRLFLALGGASGATPTDTSLIEQFQQFTGAVGTTNDLAGGAALPSLLGARRDFAVATASDARVFIIGGRTGAGQGSLVTGANTVLEFNPRTNTLTPRSNAGFTPRHSLGAAAVKTSGGIRIYAVGGYADTAATAAPVGTVEEFNPGTNTWRTVATLPTAVAQFGITVAGGVNTAESRELIHVVSGNTGSESAPSVANPNPVQRFQADPVGPGVWSTFNPAGLTLRRNHGAATGIRVVATRVFVIGGQDAGGNVLDTVQEYQAQAVTLVNTPHTSLPAARARFGIGFTLTSSQIYVIGGIDGTGADQSTILEYSIGTNGPVAGPPGNPSGAWVTRGNLSAAKRDLQVTTPPGVTNFLPVQSGGRDPMQDAIVAYIAANVRSARAPVSASDPGAVAGRQLFQQVGLVVPGFSCETCHGGPKLTRSIVDYAPPPSADIGLGLGNEQVIGAELRRTNTQPNTPGPVAPPQFPGVLLNVGTFTLGGGRTNEIRSNLADIGAAAAPLGANGFNIPSLFSVHETAPYFYSGLAQTLEEVLNGSQDGNGGVRHHFVADSGQRANLIRYLNSIEPPNDAQQILQGLIGQIQALVIGNTLNEGQGNSLIAKLQAAQASIARGNTGASCSQLEAFINEVEAFVKTGKLTTLQGQELIQLATNARNALNC
jgi:YVTN family beta-propeller protein